MALNTLYSEPVSFIAGNTIKWKKSFSDFPASDGWALSYALVKADKQILIDAVADGDDFAVTINAATSAGYDPGVYSYQATVTDGTETATIGTGKIEIKPAFSQQTDGYDARSFAKKMVDTLESLFPVLAAKGFASYSVSGRSGTYHSKADLREDYNYWLAKCHQEERRAGRMKSRIIKPRFR